MLGVAFAPDGRCAVTGGTDRIARVWSLSEDAASARDLSLVGRWDESLDAYRRAIRADPGDGALLEEKSQLDWKLGRWSNLVVDHDEHRRLFPGSTAGRLNSARVLLMAGDAAGYRRLCTSMRHAITESKAGRRAWQLALASMLAPDSGISPADAIAAAERAGEQSPQSFEIRPAIGLARYRAGQYREAIATILPVALEHADWSSVSTTWPMLVMAYHGVGDTAEARHWLEKVRDLRARKSPGFGRDPIAWTGPWAYIWDWIDFELLAREAEATLTHLDTPSR